ncbi:putative reverse transcriptase domain-containing protein [Tanacetum coccineum]
MPTIMTTRSVGWPIAASRGGGTGGRADRDGSRTRGRSSDQGDGRIDGQDSQVGGQGSEANDGVFLTESSNSPPSLHSSKWRLGCRTASMLETIARTYCDVGSTDHTGLLVQGRGNQGNQARGRAFMLGVEEARQDLNIITGTFTLNDHYATTLFDYGADYSFGFQLPYTLLGIEPNDLGFSYEIEIASRQLVEIGGIDAKAKEKKQEEIVVVKDFLELIMNKDDIPKNLRLELDMDILIHNNAIGLTIALAYSWIYEPELREVQFLGHVINGDGIHDWQGGEQENAFQTLKDKLCNAPVLALHNGLEDFVVYCATSGLGLGCVLMQRGKVIAYASKQLKIHKKNYTTHDLELGQKYKLNALSRKERVKPKRVRAMNITLQSSIKDRILAAQKEASDESAGLQNNLDEMIELGNDGALDRYWWPGMKKDIAVYRLTKSAHFLPMHKDYKMERLARLYLNEIVVRHGVPILIISDHDSRFTSRFWQSMQKVLGTRLDMSTAYHPQNRWKCRSLIMWAEIREGQLIGPELVQESPMKSSQIKG